MRLYICVQPIKNDEPIEQQRIACQDMAIQLGAVIEAEFVDAGVKADAAVRPGLDVMLAYLEQTPIDLAIASRGRYLTKRARYHDLILRIGQLGTTVITGDRQIYLFDARDKTIGPD